jgi:hypothetical protein
MFALEILASITAARTLEKSHIQHGLAHQRALTKHTSMTCACAWSLAAAGNVTYMPAQRLISAHRHPTRHVAIKHNDDANKHPPPQLDYLYTQQLRFMPPHPAPHFRWPLKASIRCAPAPHRPPQRPDKPPSFDCTPLLLPAAATPPTAAAAALLRSSATGPVEGALTLLLSPAVTACMEGLGPYPGAGSMAGLTANPAAPAAGMPGCAWWK